MWTDTVLKLPLHDVMFDQWEYIGRSKILVENGIIFLFAKTSSVGLKFKIYTVDEFKHVKWIG